MTVQHFPYDTDCIRARREMVVAADLGNFTTHLWAVVRDPDTGLLVMASGTIGVTNTPTGIVPERRFPWHCFHVAHMAHMQDPDRLAARLNRDAQIMRTVIEDEGRRVLVDSGPIDGEDIAYVGAYQRISPAKRFRRAFSDYAEAAVGPIADALFAARPGMTG